MMHCYTYFAEEKLMGKGLDSAVNIMSELLSNIIQLLKSRGELDIIVSKRMHTMASLNPSSPWPVCLHTAPASRCISHIANTGRWWPSVRSCIPCFSHIRCTAPSWVQLTFTPVFLTQHLLNTIVMQILN